MRFRGRKLVTRINPKFNRQAEVNLLLGDPSRANNELGWKRQVDFDGLVQMMAQHDYDAVNAGYVPF